ncbi:PadR family transcriptional regulator [Acinetobacter sp.]|uniref:PadR family transcriptional regulator n=1 Tax=Acinetobacter sp. TaxID=472 RepID=UPI00264A4B47|nr:PadR family transcriptional regulator [Acinetobacter sp.]MDN5513575.1 PadR family transcriptional regulator [Acinetobacter sp.]MDN5526220.1 PadR family transcriptional regulator [Acinetobacter sp.]
MKLLVLHFIAHSPKFSYDIIKDVASLVGGNYKPSTGTICPTIHYLEEHCYTEVKLSVDKRKQYHITATGLKHLAAHQDEVNKVLNRFNTRKQIQNDEQYVDIKRAMENLKTSLRLKLSQSELSIKDVQKIAEQIDQAAVNITRL